MKKAKMPADPNRRAAATVDMIDAMLDGESLPVDSDRATQGRASGAEGGKVRASRLSPERRTEIARKAAAKRWGEKSGPAG